MKVSINGRVGGATKKPPENTMKLRESRFSRHLKPTQIMLKRREFFTAIHKHLTPPYWEYFLLDQILPSNLHPYCNQNCTFLLLAESIIFLHIRSFLCSIFFCKILQHTKTSPGSAPTYDVVSTLK